MRGLALGRFPLAGTRLQSPMVRALEPDRNHVGIVSALLLGGEIGRVDRPADRMGATIGLLREQLTVGTPVPGRNTKTELDQEAASAGGRPPEEGVTNWTPARAALFARDQLQLAGHDDCQVVIGVGGEVEIHFVANPS
jgi:hypothetical protein